MRLDKFLSHQLSISRAIVGRELRAGKVNIDGEIIKQGAYKISPEQQVYYDGNLLEQVFSSRYFMLHKPAGYICATEDAEYPTILYFIDEPMPGKLHAAGRLDLDATGLVLLTDDGQWSHRITSPRHHCDKTYLATLTEPLTTDLIAIFKNGIELHNEKHLTKPANLEIVDDFIARLTVNEGRYHQVKRMFAAVGNHVTSLHRERIGSVVLDENLAPGEYRPLTEAEANSFM